MKGPTCCPNKRACLSGVFRNNVPGSSPLIETVEISNFRGFEEISIGPLGKINLIHGKGNTGKTSLLETLFLHLGAQNPQLLTTISQFRGLDNYSSGEDLWGWFFHRHNPEKPITITTYDSDSGRRKLEIYTNKTILPVLEEEDSSSEKQDQKNEAFPADEIRYRYTAPEKKIYDMVARLENKRLTVRVGKFPAYKNAIFIPARFRNPIRDAERFSRLQETGRHKKIISLLGEIESSIVDIFVSVSPGFPLLMALRPDNSSVPLSLMGEGIGRLVSLFLALSLPDNNMVLLDDMENSLHNDRFRSVWRAIRTLALEFDTQLIATTHSDSILRSSQEVFRDDSIYIFRNLQLEQVEEQIIIHDLDTKQVEMSDDPETENR